MFGMCFGSGSESFRSGCHEYRLLFKWPNKLQIKWNNFSTLSDVAHQHTQSSQKCAHWNRFSIVVPVGVSVARRFQENCFRKKQNQNIEIDTGPREKWEETSTEKAVKMRNRRKRNRISFCAKQPACISLLFQWGCNFLLPSKGASLGSYLQQLHAMKSCMSNVPAFFAKPGYRCLPARTETAEIVNNAPLSRLFADVDRNFDQHCSS